MKSDGFTTLNAMTKGVALSEDLCKVVIYMFSCHNLDMTQIAYLTDIPKRTVYSILSTWRLTGEVKPAPNGKQGRQRVLDFTDTQVS